MNKILSDGASITDIFKDISLFSQNNISIGQYSAKIIQGENNVILGTNAGKMAVDINNSVFIGATAASQIMNGYSLFNIGNNSISPFTINNSLNIGNNNTNLYDNSISIGDDLYNDGSIQIGYNNTNLKIYNSNIFLNDLSIGSITNIGFKNNLNDDALSIGNYNSNGNLNIGSSNNSTNSNAIIIGNNINNIDFSLNINNIICAYEKDDNRLIYLGVGIYSNIPIIIGSNINNDNDNNKQIAIGGTLNIDKLIIKNNNNLSITIKGNDNSPNIIYYLPSIPQNIQNLYLSVNIDGTLEWKEVSNDMITNVITKGNFICNNINAEIISGIGSFIINANLNNNNTDELYEGIQNIYFNNSLITNLFYSIINDLTTDDIKQASIHNFYYSDDLYTSNFNINIKKISTDYINDGINSRFYHLNDFFNTAFDYLISITTDDIKIGNSNIFYSEDNFNKYSNSIINNVKEGKSNLYYTNNRFQNIFNNYINTNDTTIIKEGSNKYYDLNLVNSNINDAFNLINVDYIKEGKNNLYYSINRISKDLNSYLSSTDVITEGSSNLYFYNISNIIIDTNIIKEGVNNHYFLDNSIIQKQMITDYLGQGNSNLYLREIDIIQKYNSYFIDCNITTDNFISTSNISFITNDFYNNDLIINGYINSCNISELYLKEIENVKSELYIGPLTEVVDVYDYNNDVYINTSLSNIEIKLNYDNDLFSNIPFIVIENRVGINNINPLFNLHVGTGNDTAFISKLRMADEIGISGNYGINFITSNNSNGHDLKIQTRSGETTDFIDSFIITSDGNIGIGSNKPQSLLHLNSSSSNANMILMMSDLTSGNSSSNGLLLQKDNLQNGLLWNYQNANLIFGTNNQQRLLINSNGSLLISGSPTNNSGQIIIYDDQINNTNFQGLHIKTDFTSNYCSIQSDNNIPLLLNPLYNNVGINIYNPVHKLHVDGDIALTGTVYSSFSDMRLKTKTSDLNNSLDIISKLNGFKYKNNEIAKKYGFNDDNEMIGLNAQEVNELIPEIISIAPFDMDRDINGNLISKSKENYLTINYEKIIPYLIEAIKELKKENDFIKLELMK
jgi:hypothetical protein